MSFRNPDKLKKKNRKVSNKKKVEDKPVVVVKPRKDSKPKVIRKEDLEQGNNE
jgi:hypothetical protein